MGSEIKKFSLEEESMFKLDTYFGRLYHFAKLTDLRMITLSNNKLMEYKNFLNSFKENQSKFDLNDPKLNQSLWDAQYAVKSSINLEKGNILPKPMRMCAFVPVNIPIAFGLLCLPATKFNIFLFNFINQSYNALMNYANGSGTDESTKFILMSYSLALFSSIGTGMYLKRIFSRRANIGLIQEGILRVLPSSIAGFLNAFFMRSDYITKGINVKDENGNNLGLSKICGTKAVVEGSLSRMFLPLPLLMNHFLIKYISTFRLSRRFNIFLEMSFCGVALVIGLPFSIAIFKQYSDLPISQVEKEIQMNSEKFSSKTVIYNKGL